MNSHGASSKVHERERTRCNSSKSIVRDRPDCVELLTELLTRTDHLSPRPAEGSVTAEGYASSERVAWILADAMTTRLLLGGRPLATQDKIVSDITDYVGSDAKSNWYAGIAADAKDRLFKDHAVDEKNGRWIYRTADAESAARAAEKSLHEMGFDGGTGGGDASTKAVYAYKKTSTTKE